MEMKQEMIQQLMERQHHSEQKQQIYYSYVQVYLKHQCHSSRSSMTSQYLVVVH